MVDGDVNSVSTALMRVKFDHYNITRALASLDPPEVQARKQAEKEAKAQRKKEKEAEALAMSPEQEAQALREMEGERAAAADEEAEEDDMVCISRRPPLTHNLTHSTPLPPFRRCPTSPTSSRVPPWKVRAAAASPRRRRPRR